MPASPPVAAVAFSADALLPDSKLPKARRDSDLLPARLMLPRSRGMRGLLVLLPMLTGLLLRLSRLPGLLPVLLPLLPLLLDTSVLMPMSVVTQVDVLLLLLLAPSVLPLLLLSLVLMLHVLLRLTRPLLPLPQLPAALFLPPVAILQPRVGPASSTSPAAAAVGHTAHVRGLGGSKLLVVHACTGGSRGPSGGVFKFPAAPQPASIGMH